MDLKTIDRQNKEIADLTSDNEKLREDLRAAKRNLEKG